MCVKTTLSATNRLTWSIGINTGKHWRAVCLFWKQGSKDIVVIKGVVNLFPLHMDGLRFNAPCTAIISGPTGSGKTYFTLNLLKHLDEMFTESINKIYYFYAVWQSSFEEFMGEQMVYLQELPTEERINSLSNGDHNLIIIDDMQITALNDAFIANLFSRESHHKNLSIFLILQNLFHQGKYARDISLNSHYFILFKNPRDCQQIRYLGTQLGIRNKLRSAYEDATLLPFSYLLIDLSPKGDGTFMLRSQIFPFEDTVIYK